jgi:hypothetical protein
MALVSGDGAAIVDGHLEPIDEWSAVDAHTFTTEIRPRQRPAVLRGLVADWPAVRAGRGSDRELSEHIRGFYTGVSVQMFEGPPEIAGRFDYNDAFDGFNFERRQVRLTELLDRLEAAADDPAAPALYAGSLSIPVLMPGFAAENRLDGFIHAERVLHSIWIGNRTRVAAHYDQVDNIACVAGGRRRFTVFPTEQIANLYVGPLDVTPAGQPVSLVDPSAPDFERHPRFREALAAAHVAELEPGDAIYIPSLWWHQVEALSPFNVLVNYWWRDAPHYFESPLNTLLHALLSLKGLPAGERERWRALFDHLIFQTDGEPLAHLPEAARGLFGKLTPENAARIRAVLQKSLSR